MNWWLIGMMSASIIFLFVSMMFSVWAASDIGDDNADAHKWSTYTAVLNGLAVALISIALGVYIYLVRKGYKF